MHTVHLENNYVLRGGHFSMHLANVAGIPGSPAAVCHFLMDAIQINVVLKLRDMSLKIYKNCVTDGKS